MHERTQRAVARLLFVFCCAVPTSAVLLAIMVSWTPWYQARRLAGFEHRLALETGLVFQIDRCRQVAPGKYVLENVRIRDPETHAAVATIRLIDFFRDENQLGVFLHQPRLESSGLGRAWSLLHDRLISRPEHTVVPIRVAATDLTVHSPTGSLSLADTGVQVTPEEHGVRLTAQAGSSSGPTDPRVHVDLFRDRSGDVPLTELVFSSEGTALPCTAVAEYFPLAKSLGPEAHFSGAVKCRQTPDGWTYELDGCALTGVNLSLLSSQLPHRVVGEGELSLTRCLVRPGESVSMIGTLKATRVWLERSLLRSMHDRLGWVFDDQELAAEVDGIECKLAAVHFEITDQTMQLTGVCDPFGSGIVNHVALYSRGRPIAWTKPVRVASDQITAMLNPRSRSVATWNQLFLPSSPAAQADAPPAAAIRNVRNWSGNETVQQR